MSASGIRARFNNLVRRTGNSQRQGHQDGRTVWKVISSSYVNILLVFVPLGIAAGVVDWPAMAIFVLNFLGIIPLAALLSFATEELAHTVGPAIGGLLNATFGNAIELIVSIIALNKGEYRLVQASILGSVLVNILLVLGCCFISGGIRRRESRYDPTVAGIMSALLTLASSALIVPAILYSTLRDSADGDTIDVLAVSRGTAIILIVLYFLYLVFQLRTHSNLFRDDGPEPEGDGDENIDPVHAQSKHHNEEIETTLGPKGALACLVVTTLCVGVCAEFLVDSINEIVETTSMSKTFIGLILLPIVSNAAEHVTAVIVSWKGKMNLALLVDLGSGLQIALFVTPLLVLFAWAMEKPLSLHFQLFETVVFFLSVLVTNFLIRGGTSNFLEGCLCVGWYLIIALAFFYYPDNDPMTNG
ncbi:hypothetical protein M409DRAFT_66166 [Zasmidium cellare ATCC 36951]|uniref:Vacuolar calcium ion transporter n=1 Tax=Zasmidium cellare ATCC 36951 TaxID=1080233 RepID=A0A6A6CIK5_ZASCE|nr:uncharacterized protein M409DRAFT_66166 [Zasmidium cellare ATCC 36951]KAF2167097.1 hypothetical protein M409DRAFT_66166 [Zasmidium cellare ATCC 36951]